MRIKNEKYQSKESKKMHEMLFKMIEIETKIEIAAMNDVLKIREKL